MLSTANPFCEPFPEARFFTARDGARIAFTTLGETSKDYLIPPIIMVNGLSMIKKDFLTSIAPVLARHTAVAVFDNRGMDESKLPRGDPPFSVEDMAHDTLELAQHLGWAGGRGFALVGVSLGGKIAMAAALSLQRESKRFNPRLAQSMNLTDIIICCSSPVPRSGDDSYHAALRNLQTECRLAVESGNKTPEEAQWHFQLGQGRLGVSDTYFNENFGDFEAVERFRYDTRHLRPDFVVNLQLKAAKKFDCFDELPLLSSRTLASANVHDVPARTNQPPRVLVIHGDQDRILALSLGVTIHNAITGSSLEILREVGHSLYTSDGGRTSSVILDFLAHRKVGNET